MYRFIGRRIVALIATSTDYTHQYGFWQCFILVGWRTSEIAGAEVWTRSESSQFECKTQGHEQEKSAKQHFEPSF